MYTEPEIEFYLALNFKGLSPRDISYWRENVTRICAGLAADHGIHARGWVGAYVVEPKIGYRPFYLFAVLLDLDKEEDLKKYHEVEAKVEKTIKRYIKP
jgi:divalent metal cation (Fe/Co/Zn/Cd) transporter